MFILVYMPSENNVVDLLMKVVQRDATCNFTSNLELWDPVRNRRDVWN